MLFKLALSLPIRWGLYLEQWTRKARAPISPSLPSESFEMSEYLAVDAGVLLWSGAATQALLSRSVVHVQGRGARRGGDPSSTHRTTPSLRHGWWFTVHAFNSCTSRPDICRRLVVNTLMDNMSKISRVRQWPTHLANQSKVQLRCYPCINTKVTVCQSGVRSCSMARAACAFSAGIEYRHSSYFRRKRLHCDDLDKFSPHTRVFYSGDIYFLH